MTNRNPVKQVFITFPKSNIDKVTMRDFLLQFNPEYYKVVEEEHKDGTPHLHAVVKFKNKYSCSNIIKKFSDVYPADYKRLDVHPTRSIKNAIQYLSKEDPSPLESGTFVDNRNPQKNWSNKFARELGYNSVDDLLRSHKEELEMRESLSTHIVKTEDNLRKMGYAIEEMILENFTYDEKKIRLQILQNPQNYISKDDMTKIAKVYDFKL